MKHIEFAGLPGSGKSAVKEAVLRQVGAGGGYASLEQALLAFMKGPGSDRPVKWLAALIPWRAAGPQVRSLYKRSKDFLPNQSLFTARHGDLLTTIRAAECYRLSPVEVRSQTMARWSELASQYEAVSRGLAPDGRVVFDEGFAQRGLNTFVGPGAELESDAELVRSFAGLVPCPDVVVQVEAGLETCVARLDRRGWPVRLGSADTEARRRFLADSARYFELALPVLEEHGARVIAVRNEDTVAEAARRVADLLEA